MKPYYCDVVNKAHFEAVTLEEIVAYIRGCFYLSASDELRIWAWRNSGENGRVHVSYGFMSAEVGRTTHENKY
jgi:hypothetical protein